MIGTPERVSEATNQKGRTPPDHRVACRDLGEADHEGWLAKKGKCGAEGWRGMVLMKDLRGDGTNEGLQGGWY